MYLCIWTFSGILLIGASVQLGILYLYAPNFEEVDRAYWFQLSVRASVCACISSKYACHILWTMYARVFKFHIWILILHGKIADRVFFLDRVISLSGVMPFWKNQNEIWCMPFFMSRLPKHKPNMSKFQTSVSLYLYFERNIASWIANPTWNIVYYHRLWGQTLKLGKTHSSRADCRNIKNNVSSFKHLYLCIWTIMGILLNASLVQLGILYNFLRYELQCNGLTKHILHEPIAKT